MQTGQKQSCMNSSLVQPWNKSLADTNNFAMQQQHHLNHISVSLMYVGLTLFVALVYHRPSGSMMQLIPVDKG